MIKEFNIKLDVEEDFCLSDLKECLITGSECVGNHTIKEVL